MLRKVILPSFDSGNWGLILCGTMTKLGTKLYIGCNAFLIKDTICRIGVCSKSGAFREAVPLIECTCLIQKFTRFQFEHLYTHLQCSLFKSKSIIAATDCPDPTLPLWDCSTNMRLISAALCRSPIVGIKGRNPPQPTGTP